jgi:formaldehyde-activating enzyme involved in methanogenesis
MKTTRINKVLVGEALVGEGNEVAHIDLLIGPRGTPAEAAFCNTLTNQKQRHERPVSGNRSQSDDQTCDRDVQ